MMAAALCIGGSLCAPAAAAETASTQYATIIRAVNPKLQEHQSDRLAREVIRDAQRAHIDARLLVAVVTVESAWRQSAISRTGARGFGQLMPGTAHSLGVNARDSHQNLLGASTYLGGLLQQFGHGGEKLRLAIAAYNAGPHAITRAHGIPNNGETPNYVRKVIAVWHALRGKVSDAARVGDTFVVATGVAIDPFDRIISVDEINNPAQAQQVDAAH